MKQSILAIVLSFSASLAFSETLTINMYRTAAQEQGAFVGTVTAKDTPYGLLVTPKLTSLTPGAHGFHVHQLPSCKNSGKAAGGHFDPKNTGTHLGPYNNAGHLGDLPALFVNQQGDATLPILAPRLKTSDLINHSLMIHANGDNYSDFPKKLGGGGARMACGVIKSD